MKQQSLLAQETASRAVAHEKGQKNTISNELSSIQAKLTVGKPDDQYEQEADNVADTVMSMPEPQVSQAKLIQRESQEEELQSKLIQRQTEEEEEPIQAKLIQKQPEEEDEPVQTKLISRKEEKSTASDASWLSGRLQATKGSGNPLPDNTRASMENRFGSDFSKVKIHTDASAVQMNKELHAQAFTHGNDIYFNSGKFNPENSSGKHLLAHEITHVIQQGGINEQKALFRKPDNAEKQSTKLPLINEEYKFEENKIAKLITEKLKEVTHETYRKEGEKLIPEEKAIVNPETVIQLLLISPKFLKVAAQAEKQNPELNIRFHKNESIGTHFDKDKSLIEVEVITLEKVIQSIVHEVVHASHKSLEKPKNSNKIGELTQKVRISIKEEIETRIEEKSVLEEITKSDLWRNLTKNAIITTGSVVPEEMRTDFRSGLPRLTYEEYAIIEHMKNETKAMIEEQVNGTNVVAKALLDAGLQVLTGKAKFKIDPEVYEQKALIDIPPQTLESPIAVFEAIKSICKQSGSIKKGNEILNKVASRDKNIPQKIKIPEDIRYFLEISSTHSCPPDITDFDERNKDTESRFPSYSSILHIQKLNIASKNAGSIFIQWLSTFGKKDTKSTKSPQKMKWSDNQIKAIRYLEWVVISEDISKDWGNMVNETDRNKIALKHRKFLKTQIGKGLTGI